MLKALEEARNSKLIGSGLEAQVTAVELEKSAAGNGAAAVNVKVSKAAGKKCERCWNYSSHVGEDPVYPGVCERCSVVLKEVEGA